MPTAEDNVRWLLDYVAGSEAKVEAQGGTTDGLSVDQFDAYSEDTVFYYDNHEYRGMAGLQAFIDLLAPYTLSFDGVIDAFGSEDRVTLVIKESLVRRSDGERIDYVRTATYRIVDHVIRECWIVDAPPAELAAFLGRNPVT